MLQGKPYNSMPLFMWSFVLALCNHCSTAVKLLKKSFARSHWMCALKFVVHVCRKHNAPVLIQNIYQGNKAIRLRHVGSRKDGDTGQSKAVVILQGV